LQEGASEWGHGQIVKRQGEGLVTGLNCNVVGGEIARPWGPLAAGSFVEQDLETGPFGFTEHGGIHLAPFQEATEASRLDKLDPHVARR
jgi:hypothetical protein